MNEAFVGIDVACAKGKLLPICVGIRAGNRFVPLSLRGRRHPPRSAGNKAALDAAWCRGFADEVVAYLRDVEREHDVSITRIGIDAPSAPRSDGASVRASERGLGAAGISFFKTPSREDLEKNFAEAATYVASTRDETRMPHANTIWMRVGFALFDALRPRWECIEVYPQATVRGLVAAGALPEGSAHKSLGKTPLVQLQACSRYSGWPLEESARETRRIGYGALHDRVDAYLAAFTAALPPEQRVHYGNPPHDAIWAPAFDGLSTRDQRDGRLVAEGIDLSDEHEGILDADLDAEGAGRD
jgi:hypothetical protein